MSVSSTFLKDSFYIKAACIYASCIIRHITKHIFGLITRLHHASGMSSTPLTWILIVAAFFGVFLKWGWQLPSGSWSCQECPRCSRFLWSHGHERFPDGWEPKARVDGESFVIVKGRFSGRWGQAQCNALFFSKNSVQQSWRVRSRGKFQDGLLGITVSDKQRFSWDAEGANVKGIRMWADSGE